MSEVFVYYRVRAADAAAHLRAVQQWHASLRRQYPGLRARLLRRSDDSNGLQTWMETYAADALAEGITPALQADIEAQARALTPWIDGPRHSEVFSPCVS